MPRRSAPGSWTASSRPTLLVRRRLRWRGCCRSYVQFPLPSADQAAVLTRFTSLGRCRWWTYRCRVRWRAPRLPQGGPRRRTYLPFFCHFSLLTSPLPQWYPELADKIKITLIEALPNVLPMFSKQLIDYTMSTFEENKISIATKTMVKEVQEKKIIAMNANKELVEYPFGLLVWFVPFLPFPRLELYLPQLSYVGPLVTPLVPSLRTS